MRSAAWLVAIGILTQTAHGQALPDELRRLENLTDDQVRVLVASREPLDLNGLTSLTDAQA